MRRSVLRKIGGNVTSQRRASHPPQAPYATTAPQPGAAIQRRTRSRVKARDAPSSTRMPGSRAESLQWLARPKSYVAPYFVEWVRTLDAQFVRSSTSMDHVYRRSTSSAVWGRTVA